MEWVSNDASKPGSKATGHLDIGCNRHLGVWDLLWQAMVYAPMGHQDARYAHHSEGAGTDRDSSSYLGARLAREGCTSTMRQLGSGGNCELGCLEECGRHAVEAMRGISGGKGVIHMGDTHSGV